MSTTHCGTNIVRIRVDLFNDILRFDYALLIFFFILKHIIWYDLTFFNNLIYSAAIVAPLVLNERTMTIILGNSRIRQTCLATV